MRRAFLVLAAAAVPGAAQADDTRQLDAHEHGVGALDIAIEGTTVSMALRAPGADIVGFEYAAESDADKAAIEAALGTLGNPLDLFTLPAAAGCSVTEASAELETDEDHDAHGDHDDHHEDHDEHAEGEEHHDEHKEHGEGEEHHDEHKEHAEEHEEHAEGEGHHDHDEHDDHEGEASHTEFHAEYALTCTDPAALDQIEFTYFSLFENALELEVQLVTDSGATAFEVERDDPVLDISDAL